MPLSLICDCGARFEVEDALAGQTVSCPECQQPLKAPAAQRPTLRTSAFALASFLLAVVGAFTVVGTIAAVILGDRRRRRHPARPRARGRPRLRLLRHRSGPGFHHAHPLGLDHRRDVRPRFQPSPGADGRPAGAGSIPRRRWKSRKAASVSRGRPSVGEGQEGFQYLLVAAAAAEGRLAAAGAAGPLRLRGRAGRMSTRVSTPQSIEEYILNRLKPESSPAAPGKDKGDAKPNWRRGRRRAGRRSSGDQPT